MYTFPYPIWRCVGHMYAHTYMHINMRTFILISHSQTYTHKHVDTGTHTHSLTHSLTHSHSHAHQEFGTQTFMANKTEIQQALTELGENDDDESGMSFLLLVF